MWGFSLGRAGESARRPCLSEFMDEMARPDALLGPQDLRAFCLLIAARWDLVRLIGCRPLRVQDRRGSASADPLLRIIERDSRAVLEISGNGPETAQGRSEVGGR